MSVRKIKTLFSKVLRDVSLKVDIIDDEIKELAQDLEDTLEFAKGVGLAAPQIGVSKRVIAVDLGYLDYAERVDSGEKDPEYEFKAEIMINPEIISKEGIQDSEEGCLSVPDFNGIVKRAMKVTVQYLNLNGKLCKMDGEGLKAVCFQHEIDHLNGRLYIDYLSGIKRTSAKKRVEKFLKNLDDEKDEEKSYLYGDS